MSGEEIYRRRSRRRAAVSRTWRGQLRSREVRILVHFIVVAAALLYLLGGLYLLRDATIGSGTLLRGMSMGDLRYIEGPPSTQTRDANGATVWEWREADTVRRAVFGSKTGRLTLASCTDVAGRGGTCPARLGIDIGSTEDSIWTVFGTPTRQQVKGDEKLIAYDDIGIQFRLRRFTVYSSGVIQRQGPGEIARVLRILFP